MSKAREKRVLRVGIVQSGRIVEERVLRKRATITIGQSPRNTFAIPIAHLPASYALFEVSGGKYHLRFVRGMEGRVSSGGEVHHLRTLVERGLVRQHGKHYLYAFGEDGRGKIELGDITLLFQFVAPPPPIPKLQLPAAVKKGWWGRIDGSFAVTLLVSLLVQGGAVGGLEFWWLTQGQYEASTIRPRPRLIAPLASEIEIRREEEPKLPEIQLPEDSAGATEVAEGDFGEEEDEQEDLEIPDVVDKPSAPSLARRGGEDDDPKKRYERRLSHVRRSTLLRYVGSMGGDASSRYRMTLDRGARGGRLTEAWRAREGTADARPGERRVYRGVPEAAGDGEGGGSYRRLASEGRHSGDIRTGHVATARKTESDEVRVRVRVGGGRLGRKSGTGQIDKQSVASVFRRRKRAIRRCYERSLRSSPGAEGKVTIQFTIGPAGRITNILVTEDTTGVSSIASCIVGRVRGWRFDPPDRGSVTFSKAFILSKG